MNSSNSSYVTKFLTYLLDERRYSANTISSYSNDLSGFVSFIEENEFGDIDEISPKIAEFYIRELSESFDPKSIQRKVSAIKSMYHYLSENAKIISNSPFIGVAVPKAAKHLPKIVYKDEIEEFLCHIDTTSALGKRDKLIFELLSSSGLRVSELTSLKLNDVYLMSKTIRIIGKGDKERIVPISDSFIKQYKEYITSARVEFLSRAKEIESDFVFLNYHGTPLTSRGVRDILDRLLKSQSSTMRVSPHTFRHSFATHLLNQGMDVRMVQELLGHSYLSTTQIYTKLSKESLKDIYEKSFPKGEANND